MVLYFLLAIWPNQIQAVPFIPGMGPIPYVECIEILSRYEVYKQSLTNPPKLSCEKAKTWKI